MWRFLVLLLLLSTAATSPIGDSGDTDASNEIEQSTAERKSYTDMLKEYCLAYSDIEAYNNITLAEKESTSCASAVVQESQKELQSANPNPTPIDKIKAYCSKSTEILNCFDDFTNSIDACQKPDDRGLTKKLLGAFINFACTQDGTPYISFMADGGAECIKNKASEIEACANETLTKYLPLKIPADKGVPRTEEETKSECQDVFTLKTCVLNQLKTCEKPTAANLAEELSNLLIKVTPCEKFHSTEVKSTETPKAT